MEKKCDKICSLIRLHVFIFYVSCYVTEAQNIARVLIKFWKFLSQVHFSNRIIHFYLVKFIPKLMKSISFSNDLFILQKKHVQMIREIKGVVQDSCYSQVLLL